MEKAEMKISKSLQEEIESLVNSLLEAMKRHDPAACAALFTEHGTILSPYGREVRGRDAIEATHKAWFDVGETNKRLNLLDFYATEDVGYCVLTYAGDYPQPDGSYTTESGKSVNVLRRQPNDWKFHISSLNSDDPPLA